jgi:hypothetical protein
MMGITILLVILEDIMKWSMSLLPRRPKKATCDPADGPVITVRSPPSSATRKLAPMKMPVLDRIMNAMVAVLTLHGALYHSTTKLQPVDGTTCHLLQEGINTCGDVGLLCHLFLLRNIISHTMDTTHLFQNTTHRPDTLLHTKASQGRSILVIPTNPPRGT